MGQPLNGRSTYNAFSKLSDILTSSNGERFGLGRLYDWATYTVPDAQQQAAAINARYGLTQDPSLARIDGMIASPVGAIFSLTTRAFGGSQEAQDRMLTIGRAVEGLSVSGAALTGRVADIFGAQRPTFANVDSPYSLVSRDYLSGSPRVRILVAPIEPRTLGAQRDQVGSIRTSIQGQGGSATAAAGERIAGSGVA